MRMARLSGALMFGALLVSAANLSAQARRPSDARADARHTREQARDSARLAPLDARRKRDEIKKERRDAANEARRGIPVAERAPRTTAGTVITPTSPDSRAGTSAPAGRAANPAGVLRIVETTPDSIREEPRRRTRPRAFIMRLSNREDAPVFCQSGAGHPVYGRDWCFERGFRLGGEWRRERVRDVPVNRITRGVPIDRAVLEEMLGSELVERIEDGRTELQLEQPLSGSWVESPTGGLILRIQAGAEPIAEVADRDRDGTVDVLWRRVRR